MIRKKRNVKRKETIEVLPGCLSGSMADVY
jgi:hypothetical protein